MPNSNYSDYLRRSNLSQGVSDPTLGFTPISTAQPYVGFPVEQLGKMAEHLDIRRRAMKEQMTNLDVALSNIRANVDPIYHNEIEEAEQDLLDKRDEILNASDYLSIETSVDKAVSDYLKNNKLKAALSETEANRVFMEDLNNQHFKENKYENDVYDYIKATNQIQPLQFSQDGIHIPQQYGQIAPYVDLPALIDKYRDEFRMNKWDNVTETVYDTEHQRTNPDDPGTAERTRIKSEGYGEDYRTEMQDWIVEQLLERDPDARDYINLAVDAANYHDSSLGTTPEEYAKALTKNVNDPVTAIRRHRAISVEADRGAKEESASSDTVYSNNPFIVQKRFIDDNVESPLDFQNYIAQSYNALEAQLQDIAWDDPSSITYDENGDIDIATTLDNYAKALMEDRNFRQSILTDSDYSEMDNDEFEIMYKERVNENRTKIQDKTGVSVSVAEDKYPLLENMQRRIDASEQFLDHSSKLAIRASNYNKDIEQKASDAILDLGLTDETTDDILGSMNGIAENKTIFGDIFDHITGAAHILFDDYTNQINYGYNGEHHTRYIPEDKYDNFKSAVKEQQEQLNAFNESYRGILKSSREFLISPEKQNIPDEFAETIKEFFLPSELVGREAYVMQNLEEIKRRGDKVKRVKEKTNLNKLFSGSKNVEILSIKLGTYPSIGESGSLRNNYFVTYDITNHNDQKNQVIVMVDDSHLRAGTVDQIRNDPRVKALMSLNYGMYSGAGTNPFVDEEGNPTDDLGEIASDISYVIPGTGVNGVPLHKVYYGIADTEQDDKYFIVRSTDTGEGEELVGRSEFIDNLSELYSNGTLY